MRRSENWRRLFLAAVLAAVLGGVLAAGERCDIRYLNGLDQEIVAVRVKYSTPYDEPRFDRSRIALPAGRETRIGVQGATLPELLIVDLATKSYVFEDLSGLNPTNDMSLIIAHEEGTPILRRLDAEGMAEGSERDYLTLANRPNAVDKDDVMNAASLDKISGLVLERINEQRESLGELENIEVEAGPIRNHDHALERCPEAAGEWSEENDREARWTGGWKTTVPGAMSVCDCLAGTADLTETVSIEEDTGWGNAVFFPVFWKEWYGVGQVGEAGVSEKGVSVALRFQLTNGEEAAMLGEMLADLRIDGFSTVRFALETSEADADGEESKQETEIDVSREDLDKWDAHDRVMEALTAGYARTALEGSLTLVKDEDLDKIKAGGDIQEIGGVICLFSRGTFEAVFLPGGPGDETEGEAE